MQQFMVHDFMQKKTLLFYAFKDQIKPKTKYIDFHAKIILNIDN